MRPVFQTQFGYPGGNCMAACVASLLELPIEEMPVIPGGGDENFNETWDAWLRDRGLARICFHSDGTGWMPKGYHLIAGPSPRPIVNEIGARAFHVVVGLDGIPVHDPHPDGTFLESISEVEIVYPLDLAKAIAVAVGAMICTKCGRSALGIALDGKPYCHRIGCINWKLERIKRGIR